MLLYQNEYWIINTLNTKKIETIKIQRWCKIIKISWTENKSNQKVLNMIQKPRFVDHQNGRNKNNITN